MWRWLLVLLLLPVTTPEHLLLTHLDVLFSVGEDDTIAVTYRVYLIGEAAAGGMVSLNIPIPGEVVEVKAGHPHDFAAYEQATVYAPDDLPKPCDFSPTLVGRYSPLFQNYLLVSGSVARHDLGERQVTLNFDLYPASLDGVNRDLYGGVMHHTPSQTIVYRPESNGLTVPLHRLLDPFEVQNFSMDVISSHQVNTR
jgi:hypothetical protein